MTLLKKYFLPGLAVEDRSIEVPLDWRGTSPAALAGVEDPKPTRLSADSASLVPDPAFAGKKIKLFYRVVCDPEDVDKDLPLLVFLQGGPGGAGPRLTSPTSDGWVEEAIKHYRVVLPDQRGTGRSSRVDGRLIDAMGAQAELEGADPARRQADYLKRFLADSIVRDFEYLRLAEFGGVRWSTLGQSYGGFISLCNLSTFPAGVAAAFTCGGTPHVPGNAAEIYAHTVPRMAAKTRAYYDRYPEDRRRVSLLAQRLATTHETLPDGSPFSVRRLQACGRRLGMKPAFEELHNLFDLAFCAGDGSEADALAAAGDDPSRIALFDGFKQGALELTGSAAEPLYWTLQEFIYADGELDAPIGWAAAREAAGRAEFSQDARPLMFYAEAIFPWMFEEDPALMPFKPAMDLLMEDTSFGKLYDVEQLAKNEVPLQAAVYFDDVYVDSALSLDTLSRVGSSHVWVTNEFEHDGIHGDCVFRHLYKEALDRGDLA